MKKRIEFTTRQGTRCTWGEITGLNDPMCSEERLHSHAQVALDCDPELTGYELVDAPDLEEARIAERQAETAAFCERFGVAV